MRPFPLLLLALVAGCSTAPDHAALYARDPRSILVLPPINETADINAADEFLSTITRPLAEAGFYVFPIAVVDRLMKENGLPTPGDMHGAPLNKLREVFGADTVMYIHILHWGAVPGGTGAKMRYRLVDTASGNELWKRENLIFESNTSGGGSPLGMLASLVVATVVGEILGPSQELVRRGNDIAFTRSSERLLRGPYHANHDGDRAEYAQREAATP